jgi:hypothetical protein
LSPASGTSGISGGVFTNQPNYLVYTVNGSTIQSASFLYADLTNSRLGVSTTSPSYPVHVNANASGISIYASADIVAYSDARVKGDIKVIEDALNKIQQINGVTYTRIDGTEEENNRHAGVIAQDVNEVLPEVVNTDKETGMMSVAYGNMSGLLIEAIKELSNKVKDLEDQLKNK